MAIANEDGMNVAADQYKEGFAEDAAPASEMSEDEAFGITPPAEAVAAAEGGEPAADPVMAEPAAPEPAEPAPAAGESDQIAEPVAAEPEAPVDPKEIQRKASHEGRQRKIEADRLAAESKAAVTIDAVADEAEAEGKTELAEAAEKVADQLEDGSMSAEEATSFLAQEFGEDFVKMIKAITTATATEVGGKAVAAVRGDVDEIIGHISDSAQKTHFKTIAAAYPDFNDISNDPAFKEFVGAGGDDAQRVASGGSADEVVALIKSFKDASAPAPAAEPTPEPATAAKKEPAPSDAGQDGPEGADAALGVRSGGLRLPAEPSASDDFEGAFNEASRS